MYLLIMKLAVEEKLTEDTGTCVAYIKLQFRIYR